MLLHDLARRPWRSGFTIAGVAAAACTYTVLIGSVGSFVSQFRDFSPMFGADLVVQQAGATTPFASALPGGLASQLREVPGVLGASRVGLGRAKLLGSSWFMVFGLDPGEPLAARLPLERGQRLPPAGHNVLLGERVAARLDVAPGSRIEVRGLKMTVSGITNTHHALLDGAAAMGLADAQQLFNLGDGVSFVLVDLEPGGDPSWVATEIVRRAPGTEVVRVADLIGTISLVRIVERFARLLALIAVGIAALGAANVLSLSVQERTQEIAVLRAIGWRRRRIAALVVGEGVCVSMTGGLLAVPCAVVVLQLLGRVGPVAGMGLVPAFPPPLAVIEALAVSVTAGVLGSALPLVRALRIPPGSALRGV